ncbi:MAG: hypothetical protein ACLRXC_12910 [[Clostridium] leptum]
MLIAITTDHPVTRIQYLPICAGFAQKGLVRACAGGHYCNPAKICGVADRIGTIEQARMQTWPFLTAIRWRCLPKPFIPL